jgi:hypothetical protein
MLILLVSPSPHERCSVGFDAWVEEYYALVPNGKLVSWLVDFSAEDIVGFIVHGYHSILCASPPLAHSSAVRSDLYKISHLFHRRALGPIFPPTVLHSSFALHHQHSLNSCK